MKTTSWIASAILLCATPVFAAGNPWLGTWKLNRAKSTFTGETYTVVKNGNLYHFDYGAVKFDVGEDGKDYPVIATRTASLKSTGKNEWLQVSKANGVEVSRAELKLSDDGKTLTSKGTGTRADGSTFKSESVDERVSGGPGLAGTFKSVKESTTASSVMTWSDAGAGKIKVDYPSSKGTTLVTFDGKPVKEEGPRAIPDETTTYKQVSSTEIKYTVFEKGKSYVEGVETVSADGKVLKDVSWLVTKPAEKTTAIYEKQ